MKRSLRILRRTLVVILTISLAVVITGYFIMKQPSFGQNPSDERLKAIKRNPRYVDGQFKNATETPMYPEGESTFSVMWTFAFKKSDRVEPQDVLPYVKRNLIAPPPTDLPVISWFGHSTALIQIGGKNILTDPIFSHRASPLSFVGPTAFPGSDQYAASDMPPLDAIIISHDHYDHLDYQTVLELESKTKMFIVPLGVASHLEHWGIKPEKITEADWWTSTRLPDSLVIISTPSRHFSGRGIAFNKTSWGSYVIIVKHHRIFFSGDSGFDSHFKTVGEKFGPFDVALIETGQYNDLWPYIHMMPEQGVRAALDLRARRYIPIHWAKFAESLHAWKEPAERATAEAARNNMIIITPVIGAPVIIDAEKVQTTAWWRTID